MGANHVFRFAADPMSGRTVARHSGGHVLLVDDDGPLLRGYARRLSSAGMTVDIASDGEEAAALIRDHQFDVILTDLMLPKLDGLALLRIARERDLDVPIILMTGDPSVQTATKAIEYGVHRYLLKPVDPSELTITVETAVRMSRLARVKREAIALLADTGQDVGERVAATVRFEAALDSLWIAFQPIVSWSTKTLFGYEALVRSDEKTLANPRALFDAATRLGRLHDLGRIIRERAAAALAAAPPDPTLFVNLHVSDFDDLGLFDPRSSLSQVASRVVLEITERATLDQVDLRTRSTALRDLGFRLAIDDLGAGYSGLNSIALVEPEVVKLDMALVRNVHKEPVKQRIIRSMVSLCHESSTTVIVEGVETADEREQLAALGCDLMQGYLFAKPARGFPEVRW